MRSDPKDILERLKSVVPERPFIGLHEPEFKGNEWKYLKECIDTGWVSSVGKFVDRFEEDLAAYTGVKKAVAVVNGTAALHVSLLLSGVKADDEVIIPSFTFVATANAVKYCGAVPHFADIEERTLGLDAARLSKYLETASVNRDGECFNRFTGRRIKAIMPMHTFGHPVDIEGLVDVAGRYNLELIEDAAESLGSFYKGRHTGNWGRFSALSFNGNKTITTGGGGAILTNDAELGKLAKHITTTARVPHKWAFAHDMVGFNYRLPNINAALGCAQLEELPRLLSNKRNLANRYIEAFAGIKGLRFFTEPEHASSNYWLNALILDEENASERDAILELTNGSGIMTRPAWTLMHKLVMFKDCPKADLSVSESMERRLINIPSSAFLGE